MLYTYRRTVRQIKRAREDIFELHHKVNTALHLIEAAHSIFMHPAVILDPEKEFPLYRLVPVASNIKESAKHYSPLRNDDYSVDSPRAGTKACSGESGTAYAAAKCSGADEGRRFDSG